MARNGNGNRSSYDYHEDTVAYSDHAWERDSQRLGAFTQAELDFIRAEALKAAGNKANREHTGVRILTNHGVSVWVVVAGRTVKTILLTPEGVHLDTMSRCNRYFILPSDR